MKVLFSKIALVDIAVLLFGFIDTFYIYTASSYFSDIIQSPNVGFFFFVSYLGSLILFFCLQPLVRILGKARTLYLFLLVSLGLIFFLTNLDPSYFSAAILLLFIVTSSVLWVIFDILLESFSEDSRTGSIRGLNLTLLNIGVLCAPLLSSITLSSYGYNGIFFTMLVLYMLFFIFCLLAFRRVQGEHLPKITFWHGLSLIRRDKALYKSYFLSFALFFFYAVMIIYMPLYLQELGFNWSQIGWLFTLMLIPFILIQYPLGKMADQRYGEKEILIISLVIAIICTVIMAWTENTSFLYWAVLLFISRIGIAGLEVMKDTYFYRHINAQDVDVISFFRTSLPLANILVAALATGILVFLPLASVFYLTALVLFLALLVSLTLVDSR